MESSSDRKKQIIVQASSYGPYLWKSGDIDRAILWLKQGDAGQTHQFLRFLLQSRGSLRKRRHDTAFGSDMNSANSSESSTLLESIVQGYLKSSSVKNPEKSSLSAASLASDLCDVVVLRTITADAYDLAVSLSSFMEYLANSDAPRSLVEYPLGYSRSPDTIVRSNYASQLYERLVTLCRNEEKLKKEENVTAQYLIDKISKLSTYDARICEVYVMMLLEPLSSCPCSKDDDGDTIKRSKINEIIEKKVTDMLVASILNLAKEGYKTPFNECSRNSVCGVTRISLWILVPNELICSVCDLHPSICEAYSSCLLHSAMNTYCFLPHELATNASRAAELKYMKFENIERSNITTQKSFRECMFRLNYLKKEAAEKSIAVLISTFETIVSNRTASFIESEYDTVSKNNIHAQQLLALSYIAKELSIDIVRL